MTPTHPDLAAVQDAAERCEGLFECGIVDIENMSVACVADLLTLARDRHHLTDPTPLSVESLVGMGFAVNPKSELCYKFGKLCCYADGPPEAWEWTYGNDWIHDVPPWLNPRTAGELTQLLRRMK